ncbi:MAG: signal peptidase I [Acidimicrobiales bacterium]
MEGRVERRTRVPWALELVLLVVAALCLTLVVKANVAQAFSIPSSSMEPQLLVGDRVVVSRLSYRLHDVNRGDIVVFPSPDAVPDDDGLVEGVVGDLLETIGVREPGDDVLIKRVVGLPGETISAVDGRVVVDGHILMEPYLPDGLRTEAFGPVEIPAGEVFMMGDNRGNSADSRVIGTVDVDTIVGRAIARVWPPRRAAFL